eukprot:TRINITY_DN692_c0_g1_i7.p1 TRINITY_DN692_c0_g1~~TRINITY_DN692_c0_g1_i7.p1  ORF type:complete len:275 (-),score=-1.71 TRINITY_DN692_c0_g1_i7:62-886(-)
MRKNIININVSGGLSSVTTINTPETSADREIVVWDGTPADTLTGGVCITPNKIVTSPTAVAFDPVRENPGDEYTAWVTNEGQLFLGEYPVGSAGITGPETSLLKSIATWADADGTELAANGIIVDEDFLRGCKGLQLLPQATTPSTTGYTVWVNGTGKLMYGSSAVGSGDVVGPASTYTNRVATFSDTTGKILKDSGISLSPSAMLCNGAVDFFISVNGTKSAYISSSSTSFGQQALFKQNTDNTAIGFSSCASTSYTGVDNTCVGIYSGISLL